MKMKRDTYYSYSYGLKCIQPIGKWICPVNTFNYANAAYCIPFIGATTCNKYQRCLALIYPFIAVSYSNQFIEVDSIVVIKMTCSGSRFKFKYEDFILYATHFILPNIMVEYLFFFSLQILSKNTQNILNRTCTFVKLDVRITKVLFFFSNFGQYPRR